MTDTPKFTVVDRRKFRGEEDSTPSTDTTASAARVLAAEAEGSYGKMASEPASVPASAPRLTLVEPVQPASPAALAEELEEAADDSIQDPELPPAPTTEESSFQKAAYEKSVERLDDLVRAQNPGAPPQEKIGFEHLVQQLYLSAMMQMGAGTPEGQRPRIDILGARQTIDLLDVVLDKTKGNLSPEEERTLQTVLFELRMTFLELTRMISAQPQPPMPPPPGSNSGPQR
jgi:Domain of unknown function (DUF1844)